MTLQAHDHTLQRLVASVVQTEHQAKDVVLLHDCREGYGFVPDDFENPNP